MNKAKKVLGVLIIVIAVVGISYAIYRAVNGTRSGSVQTVAESSDDSLKLLYGDLGTDIQYISDPTLIDYGIKQYPGSQASTDKTLSFSGTVNQSELTVGTFTTQDSVDDVIDYYKTQFGDGAKVTDIESEKYSFNYRCVTSTDVNSPVVIVYKTTSETVIHIARSGV